MSKYSIEQFIADTGQADEKNEFFELETSRILEVNLTDQVWAKQGSMVSYTGKIKFERERMLEHGVGKMFKRAFTGEGTSLMKATGRGQLYLADQGKKIIIFDLANDSITVNGNDLLAFEPTVKWDIKMMRRVAGMMAGGLFNIHLNGTGKIAISTYYDPLTLRVRPGEPVFTDPSATVAWSGHLQPDIHTDISMRTLVGRGSGESIQLKFEGDGFVIIHPYEGSYSTD